MFIVDYSLDNGDTIIQKLKPSKQAAYRLARAISSECREISVYVFKEIEPKGQAVFVGGRFVYKDGEI